MSPFITWAIWTKDNTAITKKIRLANTASLIFFRMTKWLRK